MKRLFGLIGKELEHSYSPKYFRNKFEKEGIKDAEYRLFPLNDILFFPELIKSEPHLRGLNVTIPYKETIISYLDELSETASALGAVNCIKINNRKIIGYNTDVIGFQISLKEFLNDYKIEKALILGSGGASKAVCYVLEKMNIVPLVVSRKPQKDRIIYNDIDLQTLMEHKLIINCSPQGMFPYIESCPDIPYEYLTENHYLFDLVYNPEETVFMKKGKNKGAKVCNGLSMLYGQAEAAWEIWNK